MAALKCLAILFFVTVKGQSPCPFNVDECVCVQNAGDPALKFSSVLCQSKSSGLPLFAESTQGRYNVDVLRIAESDVRTIGPNHFAAFGRIGSLILEQATATKSPSASWNVNAFSGVAIAEIDVKGLDRLIPPPSALINIGSSLKSLVLRNAPSSVKLDNGKFNDFSVLEKLSIDGIKITSVGNTAFSGLDDTLVSLKLTQASLSKMPTAIQTLRKLTEISFDGNKITTFPQTTFAVFPDLKILSLKENKISAAIDAGALDNLAQLEQLALDKTGLTAVPRRVLQTSNELQRLQLSANSIQALTNQDFQNAPKLSQLFLDENPISSIQADSFSPLANSEMSRIDLQKISLQSIDLSIFSSVTSATAGIQIVLNNNQLLKSLAVTDTTKFPKKATVELEATGLETIDPKVNEFIDKIKDVTIDISKNGQLQCSSLDWMAQVQCPDRMVIDDTKCTDKNMKQVSLDEYLRSVSQTSKCQDSRTQTPTPKTKGASSISIQLSVITVIMAAVIVSKLSLC